MQKCESIMKQKQRELNPSERGYISYVLFETKLKFYMKRNFLGYLLQNSTTNRLNFQKFDY